MKQVFAVLIAVLFLFSFAMAQSNDATVTQTGDLNLAEVDQQNDATATVTQTSNRTTAHDGSVNEATVNQNGNSKAVITQVQSGSGDFGGQYAEGNIGVVNQTGEGHVATIDQTGRNEEYGPNWKGYPDLGKGAYVTQTGASNTATIIQKGDANKSNILQDGIGHIAESKLLMSGSDLNTTFIKQTSGDFNQAYQIGNGSGSFKKNSFSITQTGTDNLADQLMDGNFGASGGGNSQSIEQIGDNNVADQDLVNPVSTVTGNQQIIEQFTSSNRAEQLISDNTDWHYHNGANNYEKITQEVGTGNYARQEQKDIDNGRSTILQAGFDNHAVTLQNGVAATNSISTIEQDGDDNTVNLTQSGGNSDIYQHGSNNTVMGLDVDPMATSLNGSTLDVDQLGNGNTLHLQQTNGASATVMQDGLTNTAVVIQN